MSPAARQQYLQQMRDRYVGAKRAARSALLDEAVAMTGYHRNALIRRFTRPPGHAIGPACFAGALATAGQHPRSVLRSVASAFRAPR